MSAAEVAHSLATRPAEFRRAKANFALNLFDLELKKQRGLVVHGDARASLPFLLAEVTNIREALDHMGVS